MIWDPSEHRYLKRLLLLLVLILIGAVGFLAVSSYREKAPSPAVSNTETKQAENDGQPLSQEELQANLEKLNNSQSPQPLSQEELQANLEKLGGKQ